MTQQVFSDTLNVDQILLGYSHGIFPMAESGESNHVFWVDPRFRGIMDLGKVHISKSLRRMMREGAYEVTLNHDFWGVINGCADRPETWISEDIKRLYHQLHLRGMAHSLEVHKDHRLVGGIYGVSMGAVFFAESMFSRISSASKLALVHLCDHLRQCQYELFDTQFVTPHLLSMGGQEITRTDFRRRLEIALDVTPEDIVETPLATPQEVIQRSGQIS